MTEYKIKNIKKDERKVFSNQNSPKIKLLKSNTSKQESRIPREEEETKDESQSSETIIKMVEEYFKKDNKPPETTTEFYRAGKILGKGAFGKVSLALHKLSKKL